MTGGTEIAFPTPKPNSTTPETMSAMRDPPVRAKTTQPAPWNARLTEAITRQSGSACGTPANEKPPDDSCETG